MDEGLIFSEALSRYRRFGYTLFFIMLAFAVLGLILWRWYAIPIGVILASAIGQIFSNRFYRSLSKRTGYDKSTLKFKMIQTDDKRKGLRVSKKINYQKLKELISQDRVLLLPHKKFRGIRQSYVYARCGLSLNYFEKAYNNGYVILQFGEIGPRVGYPLSWEDSLMDYLRGKM